jgi:hypothetical protein
MRLSQTSGAARTTRAAERGNASSLHTRPYIERNDALDERFVCLLRGRKKNQLPANGCGRGEEKHSRLCAAREAAQAFFCKNLLGHRPRAQPDGRWTDAQKRARTSHER